MARIVVGLFDHREDAEKAVQELTAIGFSPEYISLVANDRREERAAEIEADGAAADGAAIGASGGAVLGGVGGLLLGLGTFAIPGLGPLIAAGPIVAALTGAAVGAGIGGVVGSLTEIGIPEEEARIYAEGVRRGGSLVVVNASGDGDWTAIDVLRRHGAVDIEQRQEEWRPRTFGSFELEREPAVASSATLERPAATSRIPEEPVEEAEWDGDCRRHFQDELAETGRSYEDLRPAYEYGYHAASDPRFAGQDWDATEKNVRQDWSTRGQSAWEEVKDAVRCGWSCGRRKSRGSASHAEGFSTARNMEDPIGAAENAATGDQFDDRADRRI